MSVVNIINLFVSALVFIFVIASTYYFYNIRNNKTVYSADLTFMFYTGLFLSVVVILSFVASLFGLFTSSKKPAKVVTVAPAPTITGGYIPPP